MAKKVHILNGNALNEKFPATIPGEKIIMRECLVDGDISGNTLKELYSTRAKFLKETIQAKSTDFYYQKLVTEFEKIQNISENAEINFWFEDDLFCQVNFWFVIYLLAETRKNHVSFLVRPNSANPYNFGIMSELELTQSYLNRIKINPAEITELAKLWSLYKENEFENLVKTATQLNEKFPFLLPAIKAHIERFPENGKESKPVATLKTIMKELNTNDFKTVFSEFCKREPVYGFGDVQLKNLFDKLTKL